MSLSSGLLDYHASQRPGWQFLDDAARLRKRLAYPPLAVRQMRAEVLRLMAATRDVAISYPDVADPVVSVVIPVFNNWALTRRCLASICLHAPTDRVEVILVDDGSTDGTRVAVRGIPGLTVITNQRNRGFTHAANQGARAARGTFTFFVNNDSMLLPQCVEALLEALADDATGAAGARLLYPSGRLQEAGGAVWRDGSAMKMGNGGTPTDPRFTQRQEVDYASAAALMVRSSLLRDLGYLDERYAPGYYEDVDLCFQVRARGLRVVVEPAATAVHWEGMTYGTERRRGVPGAHSKSNQALNRVKFATKWASELSRHPAPRHATEEVSLTGEAQRREVASVAARAVAAVGLPPADHAALAGYLEQLLGSDAEQERKVG